MRKNLTHAVLLALKAPAAGQLDVWDARKAGFGIRITKGGTKTWMLMYRAGGRKRRLTLGRWPVVSVADARGAATRILGGVAGGADPAGDRAQAKSELNFSELAALYIERHAKIKKRPRSIAADEYMIGHDLLPAWGQRKISSITRSDVISLLDEIVSRPAPIHANRCRALLSTIMNFAIARDLLEVNPAYRVARPALEKSRDRRLSDDELRRLWLALELEPLKVAAIYKLALLTAARKTELLQMAWNEIDFDHAVWTLPADRTKANKEHRVPLAPSAISLLRTIEATRKSEYVFPSARPGQPVKNPQKWMKRLRARAGLDDFRMHDIRRSVASGITSLGIERLVVSKILNHAEAGVTAIYDRHSYDAEKRAALTKWDRHLIEIVTGEKPNSNVVALRG